MTTILIIIASYFFVSALFASFLFAEEHKDVGQGIVAIFFTLFGPIILLFIALHFALSKIDGYFQVKTFFFYVFKREKLKRNIESLEHLNFLSISVLNGTSLSHRIFRYAAKLIFKANNYDGRNFDVEKYKNENLDTNQ